MFLKHYNFILQGDDRQRLQKICSASFTEIVQLLAPQIIVAIGRFAYERFTHLQRSSNDIDASIRILSMTHPSPRATFNENWPEKTKEWLSEQDILQYLRPA